MGKQCKQWQTFLCEVSKITADGDCSHEIKRQKKKKKTSYIILKSRCITLPTKIHLVSYGFSSGHVWIWELDYKERGATKNWWFWTVVLQKILQSPLDCKEIQTDNIKGNQSWIFVGRTDAQAETPSFGHLMWRNDPLEKTLLLEKIEGKRRGWQRIRWLDGIPDDGHDFEQAPGAGYEQGSLACCSPWGLKELNRTKWLNWCEQSR